MERRGEGGIPLVLLDWPDAPESFRTMVAVDAGNSTWFVEVVAEHGWPGVRLVGADGEEAAWELAMHADTSQAERLGWLALVDAAARTGDVPPEHAELLRLRTEAVAAFPSDRVARNDSTVTAVDRDGNVVDVSTPYDGVPG